LKLPQIVIVTKDGKRNFRKTSEGLNDFNPHANVSTERPLSKFHLLKIAHRNLLKFGTIQILIFVKEKVVKRTYDKIGKLARQILGLN